MDNENNDTVTNLPKQDKIIEISSIRSGLVELEMQASQTMQRLENIRITPNTNETIESETNKIKGTLQAEKRLPSEILKSLEKLIAYSECEDDPEFPLPALDDVSHLALISHSIMAYLTHLDRQNLVRITSQISNETASWLNSLFHFTDGIASYHSDNAEAILRAIRLAIISKIPSYLESGTLALTHPCFYISENLPTIRLQYACRQLGISFDAIKSIPVESSSNVMDTAKLQKQIQIDLANNKTPVLVFADVASSLCGYVDNLEQLHTICKENNIWLHASGHALASLILIQGTGSIHHFVDSITINLSSWLGIPCLPVVLLQKPVQNLSLTAFESDPIYSRKLIALTLWSALQAIGRKKITEKMLLSFQTCSILYDIGLKCSGIKLVSRGCKTNLNLADVIPKPLDINILFDIAVPVVVFQFDGTSIVPKETNENISTGDQNQDVTQAIISKSIEKVANAAYFDRLNSWLGQILQRDCPNIEFEIIEHKTHGTCIRYCPFELGLGEQPPNPEILENFAQCLESHVDILRATIKHKVTFNKLVEKSNVLRLVQLPDWAGLGGVRFVPEEWEALLTDQAKTELNKLNVDLVEALKSTDNAFSLGEGPDSLICVRFGMVTHDTDVEELLDLVISIGRTVQKNSKVLDTMSEIVKKGIEAAIADLQRETEEKLWSEGILRHVPVVGRMVNWWSPPQKESGIKGRSLNLQQGVVESTENIYKYHMQMTGAPNQLPANKSPPTPMVQTSVGTTSSNNHSRNVSQSSVVSTQEVLTQN